MRVNHLADVWTSCVLVPRLLPASFLETLVYSESAIIISFHHSETVLVDISLSRNVTLQFCKDFISSQEVGRTLT